MQWKKKKNYSKLFVKNCSGTKSERCLTINDKTMHLEKVIQSLVWSGTKVEQCLAINRVSEIKREHSHFLVRGRIGENHLKHWKWKIKKEKIKEREWIEIWKAHHIGEHWHILVRGQIGENQLKKKKTLKIWKGKQFVPKKRKKKEIRNWKLIISKSWTGVGSGKSSKRLKSFYFSDFGGNCANKEPVFVGISLPVEFFFIVHAQSWVMAFEAI